MRIGELMAMIPKASGGDRKSEDFKKGSAEHFEKSKSEIIKQAGFTEMQAKRFQTLAAHPEIVEQAKAEARVNMRAAQRNTREV